MANGTTPGLDGLQHIVVVMMENRSFDHMLGSLKADNPTSTESTGRSVTPTPPGNRLRIAAGTVSKPTRSRPGPPFSRGRPADLRWRHQPRSHANMQGFVKNYFNQRRDVTHSRKIMYNFPQAKLPVLTTLALDFAVFNRWFAAIPGPTLCNRAFVHYGTSFGRVEMNLLYTNAPFKSIYSRLINATPKHTAKLYYYDEPARRWRL